MASIRLDDESIPLTVRRRECVRLLNCALSEAKKRGYELAYKNAAYYSAKDAETAAMVEEGISNTAIAQRIKGRPKVNAALLERDIAEIEYRNALEAINVYKLVLKSIEADIEREYEQARRTV